MPFTYAFLSPFLNNVLPSIWQQIEQRAVFSDFLLWVSLLSALVCLNWLRLLVVTLILGFIILWVRQYQFLISFVLHFPFLCSSHLWYFIISKTFAAIINFKGRIPRYMWLVLNFVIWFTPCYYIVNAVSHKVTKNERGGGRWCFKVASIEV